MQRKYLTSKGNILKGVHHDNLSTAHSSRALSSSNRKISLSHINEPNTLYNYNDIIDDEENESFNIDYSAYSDEIQQRFLKAKPFVLSSSVGTDPSSVNKLHQTATSQHRNVPKQATAQTPSASSAISSSRSKSRLEISKSTVLRHRSSTTPLHYDQFIVTTTASAAGVGTDKVTDKQSSATQSLIYKDPVRNDQKAPTVEARTQNVMELDHLLDVLTAAEQLIPSRTLLFNVFLSIRKYISMSDFLIHLIKQLLRHSETGELNRRITSSALRPIKLSRTSFSPGSESTRVLHLHVQRCLFIVTFWIDTMPYDFRAPTVMQRCKELFAICLNKVPCCFVDVRLALRNLYLKFKQLESYEEYLDRQNRLHLLESEITITEICRSASQLAEQLYIIETDHLRNIGPEEYVQYLDAHRRAKRHYSSLGSISDSEDTQIRESKRNSSIYDLSGTRKPSSLAIQLKTDTCSQKYTFNLEAYIRWINRLSYYVTTEIVRHRRKRVRAVHIEFFIDVAERSLQLNNFNSTMSIISGIDDFAVKRLNRTWMRVSKSHQTRFHYFHSLMSVSNNFATYRHAVANVLATKSVKFYIPFLCVVLKDLYYINEVMPDLVDNNLINIDKMEKVGGLVIELARLGKSDRAPFKRQNRLIDFFLATPVYDNSTLLEFSTTYEPDPQ